MNQIKSSKLFSMPRFHRLKSPLQNVWTPWQQDFEIKSPTEWSRTRCFHISMIHEVWTFWTLNISNHNIYVELRRNAVSNVSCIATLCILKDRDGLEPAFTSDPSTHRIHRSNTSASKVMRFQKPDQRIQTEFWEREREVESPNEICVNNYKTWAQKTRTKVTQTRNLHLSRAFFTAAGNHNPTWMWRLWRFVCSETTVAHHGHCSLEGPAPGVPAQTNWTMETEPPRNAMPKMWLIF